MSIPREAEHSADNEREPSVNVYIDGYNFYCSINHRSTLRLGWCNFIKLSHRLADRAFGSHRLGAVKYFTAHIPEHLQLNSGEVERQKLWLDALRLETRGAVTVVYGYFDEDQKKPRVEKQTDVNLAISLVRDGGLPPVTYKSAAPLTVPGGPVRPGRDVPAPFDKAILISGDRDFFPAVELVAWEQEKNVTVFFPLGRGYREPDSVRVRFARIEKDDLEKSRLEDRLARPDGSLITWDRYLQLKGDRFPD
ncbi:MAG: NYN domain-containing protein [Bryobacteraceae bacterium]